ncbi:MAG: amino acid adenylation domain-containing protein [Candidatus Obscuribacter sp.]|nr:amino acid adenylation domain-containing protein [Candidatus Obscuribacter sp.]
MKESAYEDKTPDWQSFLAVFQTVVQAYPERPAVIEEGREFTYRRLYEEALHLAARLKEAGAAPETVLALCLPKSYDYIKALLATWLVRAAFAPVDAALPVQRLQYIFQELIQQNKEQGQNKILVLARDEDQEHLLSAASDQLQLQPVPFAIAHQDEPPALSNAMAQAGDLAYIIFTSGSTGRPKGVMVEQRGLVNLLKEQIQAFSITEESRSLFYLSTSFDASISDIGTALLSGAALIIEKADKLRPGKELIELMKKRQVSYVDIPPSVLKLLDPTLCPPTLKSIVIGGEVCPQDVVRTWAARVKLVCVYGPTEATVCTSLTHCGPDWQAPLIGAPIKDISYLVLKEDGTPAEVGESGELFIAGIGLARGYLHRSDLNRERFLTRDGIRYYKTCDRVLVNASGNHEFQGRIDRQMKLRGLLIEPEEIEARLCEHPQIARAAVLKRAVSPKSSREMLVAFLLPSRLHESLPNARELRLHLSRSLPVWMLPQRYQWLETLPLTASGKIDLTALAAHPLKERTSAPPPSNTRASEAEEELIARCLCRILGYEQIDLEDDFFDLGLDSLGAVELAAALSVKGLDLSPEAVFTHPSCTRLARFCRNSNTDHESADSGDVMEAAALTRRLEEWPKFQALLHSGGKLAVTGASERKNRSGTLFTGATGFLGIRLLKELLESDQASNAVSWQPATLYALVRARNQAEATTRILNTAGRYLQDRQSLELLNSALSRGQLRPLPGNIEEERLGLEDCYEELTEATDRVIHLAARVNMVLPYRSLEAANTEGTLNLAAFAMHGRLKDFHYASTLSVFVSTDQNHGRLLESDDLSRTRLIWGGYAQSKWLAEVLLRKLGKRGLPLSIYRLGLITGDTTNGIMADSDFLTMFLNGLRSMNTIPQECLSDKAEQVCVDITPVDYAATGMSRLITGGKGGSGLRTFHIANSESLSLKRLCLKLKERFPQMAVSPLGQWRDHGDSAAAAAYLGLCRLLVGTQEKAFGHLRSMDLFQATDVCFDTVNTDRALAPLRCPQPDERLIELYVNNLP